jgi:hypothetical protein
MPRARRSLTDAEVLGMALNTSTARRLQGRWPEAEERRHDSIVHTAKFLWLALGLTILALGATFAWELYRAKEDCKDLTNTAARIECTQRGEGKTGAEGQKVRHGAQSGRKAGGGA